MDAHQDSNYSLNPLAGGSLKRIPSRLLTCDEVAWLGDVLDRHAGVMRMNRPGISRAGQAAKLAAIIEICELLNLGFQDRAAAGNAIAGFPELYVLRESAEPVEARKRVQEKPE